MGPMISGLSSAKNDSSGQVEGKRGEKTLTRTY
jgi:hypothetical protein